MYNLYDGEKTISPQAAIAEFNALVADKRYRAYRTWRFPRYRYCLITGIHADTLADEEIRDTIIERLGCSVFVGILRTTMLRARGDCIHVIFTRCITKHLVRRATLRMLEMMKSFGALELRPAALDAQGNWTIDSETSPWEFEARRSKEESTAKDRQASKDERTFQRWDEVLDTLRRTKVLKGPMGNMLSGILQYSAEKYVQVVPGSCGVIISVPHDGEKELPCTKREHGTSSRDIRTLEIGHGMRKSMSECGANPFMVTTSASREWVDLNRGAGELSSGSGVEYEEKECYDHFLGKQVYTLYHGTIEYAIAETRNQLGQEAVPQLGTCMGTKSRNWSGRAVAGRTTGRR